MRRWPGLCALILLGGCGPMPMTAPSPPQCPALPTGATPVEATPAGACWAEAALAWDNDAALMLGDHYRALDGHAPRLDTRGRQIRWYRLAADRGSPRGAWEAAQLIDVDPEWQVPNDALAYAIFALEHGEPAAGDYLIDQWQAGRIERGKLYRLRQWLDRPSYLPPDERRTISEGLDAPADELESE